MLEKIYKFGIDRVKISMLRFIENDKDRQKDRDITESFSFFILDALTIDSCVNLMIWYLAMSEIYNNKIKAKSCDTHIAEVYSIVERNGYI